MAKPPLPKAQEGPRRPKQKSDQTAASKATPLNFKVPAEFWREFKTYAAQHNKKLNQLLYEAFSALEARHAD